MTPDDPLGGFLETYLSQQEEPGLPTTVRDEARPGEWRTVWSWMEVVEGEILPASLELLGRGREIADELGTRNCAVFFGHGIEDAAARLGEHGADRVYVLDAPEFATFSLDRFRDALVAAVRERRPEIMLFPATVQGRNLGAQLASAVRSGIVPNCSGLSLDATERLVVGQQTSFDERLLSDVATPLDRPQIFTLTPGSARRPPRDVGRKAQLIRLTAAPETGRERVRVLGPAPPRTTPLDHADAVVAGGLGLGSAEAFALMEQLAEELQAHAGATRAAVACGWAPTNRLITATRHQLRPRLYLACGVVGEYDHLKAVEGADFVVALTADANAPIAERADLVGIGEPVELVHRVLAHLRKAKKDRVTIA